MFKYILLVLALASFTAFAFAQPGDDLVKPEVTIKEKKKDKSNSKITNTDKAIDFIDGTQPTVTIVEDDFSDFQAAALIIPPFEEPEVLDSIQLAILGIDPSGVLFKNLDTLTIKDIKDQDIPEDFKNKELSRYYFHRGMVQVNMQDHKSAKKYFTKAIKKDKDNRLAYLVRGNTYAEDFKFKKALKDITTGLKGDSTDAAVFYNMAAIKVKQGRKLEALKDFNKAIELRDDYALAYQGRASVKTELEDYIGAIEDYSKVVEINPYFIDAYLGRGVSLSAIRKYQSAANDFNHVANLKPDDGNAFYYRGLNHFMLNNYIDGCRDMSYARTLGVIYADEILKNKCK